ncbi:teichuronic acid biosynthesis glycosyltransferase TuaG [Ruminococcaceae bacterium YRB3002]|nr:teichuronic acid biosynthesis glycosyltransferase TuaG [Ruminococcaceae bacterium YRB3002]
MMDQASSELISVILPVYNSEQSVEASINSVLAQTYRNIELIIVDDASDDNTHQICRALSSNDRRIIIITNKDNCGALGSRYKAVNVARGEWIAFIDADDLWHPEKLEKQLRLRDSKKSCDLVFTASAFIDAAGNKYDWILHVPGEVSYRRLLKQNIISNSSVLMRKEDYNRYAPLEAVHSDIHEDYACWLRMLRDGLTACGIDEPLLTYRVSRSSRAGNKMKAAVMNMHTYRYVGLSLPARIFYEACYAVNGLLKYRHFA